MQKQVKTERTGWRDLKLNDRHRKWGFDCPATDIDFLFLEYDKKKAIALIEYKHERAGPQKITHATYQAMIDLGNRAKLPILCARYADDFSWWKVIPLNSFAKKWVPERLNLNEKQWVSLLYRMRGRDLPKSIFENWNEQ